MDTMLFPIIAGVIVVVLIGVCAVAIFERKRREDLRQLADAHNWRFDAKGGGVTDRLAMLPLLQMGHGREARNLLTGPDARGDDAFWVFDYQYTTGSGKSRNTTLQTLIALQLAIELPRFRLRPEHFFDKIGAAFGFQDINFESNPEFSKRFVLQGEGEVAIRALFNDDLLATLASRHGYSIEADGRILLIYRNGRREKTATLVQALEEARGLANDFVAAAESAPERSVIRPASVTPAGDDAPDRREPVRSAARRTRGVSFREVPRAKFD